MYGGEDYSPALLQPGWDVAPFPADPAGLWKGVQLWDGPGCMLRPQLQPPVKIREQMPVPNVTVIGPGSYKWVSDSPPLPPRCAAMPRAEPQDANTIQLGACLQFEILKANAAASHNRGFVFSIKF